MPIYEYKCPKGHLFELFQRMSDPQPEACVVCGASPVARVLHPVAVHYKGSGFYSTDYGKTGSRKGSGSGDGSSTGSDGGGSGSSGDSGGSGSASSSGGGSGSSDSAGKSGDSSSSSGDSKKKTSDS